MKSYKKLFWIIAFFTFVGLIMVSCDLDETTVGAGNYEISFVNESSYDITVTSAQTSTFKSFTVKSKKTVILKTNDWTVYYNYTNSDKVSVYPTSGKIVFRNK